MGEKEVNRAESQPLSLSESGHAQPPLSPEDHCSSPKLTESDKLEDDDNHKVLLPDPKMTEDPAPEQISVYQYDKDTALAQVEAEKRLALIRAWEESEKTKADNKAQKKFSAVGMWEDTRKASVEAELKKLEEKYERKKAEFAEKMKNRVAEIHQAAEEKRASVDAKRKEEYVKVEDAAAGYRAKGAVPRKFLGRFMP